MRTGGVYGFIVPSEEQPRRPGECQSYDITLVGRVVTVLQNGRMIIDKQEIPGITECAGQARRITWTQSSFKVVRSDTLSSGIL